MSQYGSTTTIENDGPAGRPFAWVPRPALTALVATEPASPAVLTSTAAAPDHVSAFAPGVAAPHRAPAFERGTAPRTPPTYEDAADAPGTVASPWDHTDPKVWFRALLVPGLLLLAVVVIAIVAIASPA